MMKRLVTMLALVCIACGILCACESKEEITADEAISIVLEDLGTAAENAGEPHVHTGTYENESCYNIYITVDDLPFVYTISTDGEILYKGFSDHSH